MQLKLQDYLKIQTMWDLMEQNSHRLMIRFDLICSINVKILGSQRNQKH